MTEQEAKAQQAAERRWPKPLTHTVGYSAKPSHVLLRDAFVAGAAWERSRVVAAPSDTDEPTIDDYREAYEAWHKEGQRLHAALLEIWRMVEPGDTSHITFGDDPQEVVRAVVASRASQPVQVEPWKTENLEIVNGWLVERGVNPLDYPAGPAYGAMPYSDAEPLVNLAEVPGWPVQVEVTAELAEWADYFEHFDSTVGAPPLDGATVARLMRGPRPFGVAALGGGDQ